MTKTVHNYFQVERQLLNEALDYYSTSHPEQAAQLTLGTSSEWDPHTERLLEGVAYLNARTKQQIDLGTAQATESLLRQLAPRYLMPYPSMTIVEFANIDIRNTQAQIIPAHTQLMSQAVGEEQTACHFTTAQEVRIAPWNISDITIRREIDEYAVVTLAFKVNEGAQLTAQNFNGSSFYINAKPAIAKQWHYYLTQKIAHIKLKTNDILVEIGNQENVLPVHLDLNDGLMSSCTDGLSPFELLQDYFAFEEKFYFFALRDLKMDPHATTFAIELQT